MTQFITVTAEKGGVAKTTTVMTLGRILAGTTIQQHPAKVLVVDLDTQGHCATMVGLPPAPDVFEFFISRRTQPQPNVQPTPYANLDILAGNTDTATLNTVYASRNTPTSEIAERMTHLGDGYDIVILDAPVAADRLRDAALTIASTIVLPVKPESLSIAGIQPIIDVLPGKTIIILPTMTMANRTHKGYMKALADWWPDKVVHIETDNGPTILNVPHRAEVLAAAEVHKLIVDIAPSNSASLAYIALAGHIRALLGETYRI